MTNPAEAVVLKALNAVAHSDFAALDDLFRENVVYQDPRLHL